MSTGEFNSNNNEAIPSVGEVAQVYGDVIAHNKKRTGLGVALARLVTAQIEVAQNPDNLIEPAENTEDEVQIIDTKSSAIQDNISDKVSEDEMSADLLEILNKDTFLRIGISLNPTGNTIKGVTSSALRPHISNGQLYAEFVDSISGEMDDNTRQLLEDVAKSTSGEIRELVKSDLPNKDEIIADRMRAFDSVSEKYTELGASPNGVDKYITRWGENVLEEYIEPEDRSVLADVPSVWHLDKFGKDWKDALPFVDRLLEDPRTAGLADEIKNNLIACIENAKREIDNPDRDYSYARQSMASLEEILNKLEGRGYDAETIATRWFGIS